MHPHTGHRVPIPTLSRVFPNLAREEYISLWRSSTSFLHFSTALGRCMIWDTGTSPASHWALVLRRVCKRESSDSIMEGALPFEDEELAIFSILSISFSKTSMVLDVSGGRNSRWDRRGT